MKELRHERFVEPKLVTKNLHGLRRRFRSENKPGRITRDQLDNREGDYQQDEQCYDQMDEPADAERDPLLADQTLRRVIDAMHPHDPGARGAPGFCGW